MCVRQASRTDTASAVASSMPIHPTHRCVVGSGLIQSSKINSAPQTTTRNPSHASDELRRRSEHRRSKTIDLPTGVERPTSRHILRGHAFKVVRKWLPFLFSRTFDRLFHPTHKTISTSLTPPVPTSSRETITGWLRLARRTLYNLPASIVHPSREFCF